MEQDIALAEVADVETVITLALSRAGLSHKQACACMDGLDPSQWSKQLKGQDKHQVSLQRLFLLPRRFWVELMALLGARLDIVVASEETEDAALMQVVSALTSLTRWAAGRRALRRRTA
jgi:hypothetical protein